MTENSKALEVLSLVEDFIVKQKLTSETRILFVNNSDAIDFIANLCKVVGYSKLKENQNSFMNTFGSLKDKNVFEEGSVKFQQDMRGEWKD